MTHRQLVRALEHLIIAAAVMGGAATVTAVCVWKQDTEKLLAALAFLVVSSLLTWKVHEDVHAGIKK